MKEAPNYIIISGCRAYCPNTYHMCRLGSECLDGNDAIEYIRGDLVKSLEVSALEILKIWSDHASSINEAAKNLVGILRRLENV
jgi:hypothetical protein